MAIPPFGLNQTINDAVSHGQGYRGQVIGGSQFRCGTDQGVSNVSKYGFPQHFRRTPLSKKLVSGHIMRALLINLRRKKPVSLLRLAPAEPRLYPGASTCRGHRLLPS